MQTTDIILRAIWQGALTADNVEAGFTRIRAITGCTLTDATLADAVAECLAQNLIREPIRLPEGALQCHWVLELTAGGATIA